MTRQGPRLQCDPIPVSPSVLHAQKCQETMTPMIGTSASSWLEYKQEGGPVLLRMDTLDCSVILSRFVNQALKLFAEAHARSCRETVRELGEGSMKQHSKSTRRILLAATALRPVPIVHHARNNTRVVAEANLDCSRW